MSLPTRRLGRTEHESSVAILGGACFAMSTPDEAEAPFREAIERGVNHLDVAPGYAMAEAALGPHIPAVRERLFVACKTGRKNADGVRAQLENSLRTLQVDHLDLYQLHGVTSPEEFETRIEALEVILEARERGWVRHVGVTGHDLGAPAAHLEALRRYDVDTVMFPVYPGVYGNAEYRADAEALLRECAARDAGAMAIKAVARTRWADLDPDATTWYRPYTDSESIARGVRFALSTEGVTGFCTPSDLGLMTRAIDAAEAATPMDEGERSAAIAAMAGEPLPFPLVEHRKNAWEGVRLDRNV